MKPSIAAGLSVSGLAALASALVVGVTSAWAMVTPATVVCRDRQALLAGVLRSPLASRTADVTAQAAPADDGVTDSRPPDRHPVEPVEPYPSPSGQESGALPHSLQHTRDDGDIGRGPLDGDGLDGRQEGEPGVGFGGGADLRKNCFEICRSEHADCVLDCDRGPVGERDDCNLDCDDEASDCRADCRDRD
jgi:hypothetical protein